MTSDGRLRLDAVARYLQDVAHDDMLDAGFVDSMAWIVRRTAVEVRRFPATGEVLELVTWCAGTGSRWAERRTSITGVHGGSVEATALWVHLDLTSGRPALLPDEFFGVWGEAAGGRAASSRLVLGDPPSDAQRMDWHQRRTDHDTFGHMNNARAWEAVEEVLLGRTRPVEPLRAVIEHRRPVAPNHDLELVTTHDDSTVGAWLVAEGESAIAAQVSEARRSR